MAAHAPPAAPGRSPPWTVIVLADRGLDARWLFRRIVRLGGPPFLRINRGGTFRRPGQARYAPLTAFVPTTGTSGCGVGPAFQGADRRLVCTLLARWEEGCRDPWLLLTDLPPERAARLWLVVAVATAWLVSVGGAADAALPESSIAEVTTSLSSPRRQRRATRRRLVGGFRQGLVCLLVAMIEHQPLPVGWFRPEPWPTASQFAPTAATTLPIGHHAAA